MKERMRQNRLASLPGLSGSAMLLALAAPITVTAQVTGTDARGEVTALEEVIVTATKRSERLQDVPVAVSTLGADEIARRGFTQYADYLNTVPSVYFEDLGPGRSQIRIRGLSTAEGGGQSTVATYFGEAITSVVTLAGGKTNLRLVDIDRVEVLRGPQGTLFGANALAGVVRVLPAAADVTAFDAYVGTRGFATAHSSDVSYHVEGMVNLPLVSDRLALRLVGYKDDIAGYIDNIFPGREAEDWTEFGEQFISDYYGEPIDLPDGSLVNPAIPAFSRRDVNSEDTWGGRVSLAWELTDRLRMDLMLARQRSRLNSEPFTLPAAGPYAASRGLDYFRHGRYEENVDIGTLTMRYGWDTVELVSATSHVEFDRIDVYDGERLAMNVYGLPPLPWSQDTPASTKQFSQEVRLQSKGEGRLQWTVGAFYLTQESSGAQINYDLSCPSCLGVALTGDPTQTYTFQAVAGRYLDEEQRALFGEVSYDLTPKWTAGIGARYFEGVRKGGAAALTGWEVGGLLEVPENRKNDYELNPAAYLRYKPSEELMLYLQIARGFRSGAANPPLPASCFEEAMEVGIGALTQPDKLTSYELGAKTLLAGGRVSLNAAVYRADWEGVQIGANLDCGFSAIVNGGDAVGKGAELELAAALSRGWTLNFAAGYNHNEFDRVAPQTGFVKGERLPNSFEKNATVGLQYDFDWDSRWAGFARVDYSYVGDVLLKFGHGVEALYVKLPSQQIANLRFGVRRDALSVELYGRNVMDERGIASMEHPAEGSAQVLIRPREIGVEVRYTFN